MITKQSERFEGDPSDKLVKATNKFNKTIARLAPVLLHLKKISMMMECLD